MRICAAISPVLGSVTFPQNDSLPTSKFTHNVTVNSSVSLTTHWGSVCVLVSICLVSVCLYIQFIYLLRFKFLLSMLIQATYYSHTITQYDNKILSWQVSVGQLTNMFLYSFTCCWKLTSCSWMWNVPHGMSNSSLKFLKFIWVTFINVISCIISKLKMYKFRLSEQNDHKYAEVIWSL